MKPDERKQLARLLGTIDEAYLVALANMGLVRRATKDLEAGGLSIEEADDAMVVKGPDWKVWMPRAGPSCAKDDTKATGITRQILSATIFLRDNWSKQELAADGSAAGTQSTAAESGAPAAGSGAPAAAGSGAPSAAGSGAAGGLVAPVVSEQLAGTDYSELGAASVVPPTSSGQSKELGQDQTQSPNSESNASGKTRRAAKAPPTVRSEKPPLEGEALQKAVADISVDDLTKWAGKRLIAEGQVLIAKPLALEVESPFGLTIRFPVHEIEIRLTPSSQKGVQLLDQILSTAPKAMHKYWVVTAVLALKKHLGKEIKPMTDAPRIDDSEAPRNRTQVLHETKVLIENMLSAGVAHPSKRMIERLFTLSITAGAVHLPRIAHLLRSLAEEVSRLLSRDAAGDTERLFATMTWTYALVAALEARQPDLPQALAGAARTQYDPAGDLSLAGIGCYPWKTDSGFEGITVLFWDTQERRFLTLSNSRQAATSGNFDVNLIYDSEVVWSAAAPDRLSRSSFILKQARINAFGRLSTSQHSKVTDALAPVHPAEIDFGPRLFKNWAHLKGYASAQYPIGLKTHDPLDRIVVLEPNSWHDRVFDELQQSLSWQILDDLLQPIALTVPWNPANENTIEFIESLKPDLDGVKKIVARIVFGETGFTIEPLSFLGTGTQRGERVLNPAFDISLIETRKTGLLTKLRAKFGRDRIHTTMTSDDDWEESFDPAGLANGGMPPVLRNLLFETQGLILQLAESGTQRLTDRTKQHFTALHDRATSCGLVELGQALDAIASDQPTSARLLWANYLCRLHLQAAIQSRTVA